MRTRATAAVISLVTAAGLVLSGVVLWEWTRERAELRTSDGAGPALSVAPQQAPPEPSARPGRPEPRTDARLGSTGTTPTRTSPRPLEVTLVSLGVQMPVRAVGVSPDGQMRLPADPRVLGWYRFGPAPGASEGGSVVLAGHLDSKRYGVGPLVRLRDVTERQRIEVASSDGRERTYVVERVDRFDRQQLPEALFARNGPERLRLITCGGDYDPVLGYEQNLVVTARPG